MKKLYYSIERCPRIKGRYLARTSPHPDRRIVVGWLQMYQDQNNVWKIQSLFVNPIYRRHGIGLDLALKAFSYVKRKKGNLNTLFPENEELQFLWPKLLPILWEKGYFIIP